MLKRYVMPQRTGRAGRTVGTDGTDGRAGRTGGTDGRAGRTDGTEGTAVTQQHDAEVAGGIITNRHVFLCP